MSDDTSSPWQRPTSLSLDDGSSVLVFENTLADAAWPDSHPAIKNGLFVSLWMPTPDVVNDLNKASFSFYQKLAIEGDDERYPVAIDSASLRWLSGRSVGYVPERRADGRVRLARLLVRDISARERQQELERQRALAVAARHRLEETTIELDFHDYLDRFLAEPGRVKVDAKHLGALAGARERD